MPSEHFRWIYEVFKTIINLRSTLLRRVFSAQSCTESRLVWSKRCTKEISLTSAQYFYITITWELSPLHAFYLTSRENVLDFHLVSGGESRSVVLVFCLVSVVLNSPCNGLLCHHESRKRPERQPLPPVLYSSALTARKLTRRGKSPGVPTSPRGGHGLYSDPRRACFKPRTSFILTQSHALLLNNYSQSWATF